MRAKFPFLHNILDTLHDAYRHILWGRILSFDSHKATLVYSLSNNLKCKNPLKEITLLLFQVSPLRGL